MKRWFGIALILAMLLLAACGNDAPVADNTENIAASNAATNPDASVPEETGGPVAHLEISVEALAPMGDGILLFGDGELTLLSQADGSELVSAKTPGISGPDSGLVQIRENGVAYCDGSAVIFLDSQLTESGKFQLPEDVQGTVYLTPAWDAVYYCSADGIRVLDLQTGLTRNLLLLEGQWLGIDGAFCGGTLLRCRMEREDGTVRTLLVSAQSGETVYSGEALEQLVWPGEMYFYYGAEGEWIFGRQGEQPGNLWLQEDECPAPMLESGAVVTFAAAEEGLEVALYDLTTGIRTACQYIAGETKITDACSAGGYVWLSGEHGLYRWDTAHSATGDETCYTEPRYTLEDPDEEALAYYQQWAQELEESCGVDIMMWMEPGEAAPENITFTLEYQPSAYETGFAALEAALSRFPEDFLRYAAHWSDDEIIHICLVRGITDDRGQSPTDGSGIQYLRDGGAYIALSLEEDLEQSFYHSLAHLLDTLILSHSHDFDSWSKLNSKYFSYYNDYTSYLENEDDKYLKGDDRYFIDSFSMSSAVEDRCRIFEYAILPGNEEYFTSKYMQKKLATICGAIREVFELEDGEYIWEQYLTD